MVIKKIVDFIPLISDTMFKEVFGKNKKALSLLLSWQFNLDYNYVYDNLVYLNTSLLIHRINNYKFTTDILVRIKDVFYNIEMNRRSWNGMENRNFAYLTKIYSSQFKKGNKKKEFIKAKKVIQINYNCFNEPEDKNNGESKMYDLINKKITSEMVTQININLALIKEKSNKKDVKELTGIEKISRLLLSKNRKEVEIEMTKELDDTIKLAEDLSISDEVIDLFDEEVEAELTKNSIESAAKEDGIKQGITKMVKNMLKMKIDLDTISKASGMSKKDILKLKTS